MKKLLCSFAVIAALACSSSIMAQDVTPKKEPAKKEAKCCDSKKDSKCCDSKKTKEAKCCDSKKAKDSKCCDSKKETKKK